jgi:hypothetical protein
LFEYPYYYKGKKNGSLFVSTPVINPLTKGDWKGSRDLDYNKYPLVHEIGNLLSYPSTIEESPYYKTGITKIFPLNGYSMNNNPNALLQVDFKMIQEYLQSEESEVTVGSEIGYRGFVWSGSIKGNYAWDNLSTHHHKGD